MTLTPGTRIGPYEIAVQVGAGGMGEVYRARDTKLNRDVALKVLPGGLADDPDRLARFRREAQILASLNHPHIAAIYGFEEAGPQALVLEFVEGPTLADRIALGPLPLGEALPVARQIAEALESAHEHGIVHRDLKPANIKLRPDGAVKVLDFGLAKALENESAQGARITDSPTITSPAATRHGMILGTAAYMSPEQARGKPVDKRTDVWAFGCVLYEMLTAKRAFHGEDVTDTLARIIEREPDFTGLPRPIPPSIERLLRRCLMKDRTKRLPDIGVARMEIDDALAAPASGERARSNGAPLPTRERLLWLGAIVTAAIAALTSAWYLRPASDEAPEVRLQINTPPGNPAHFAMSPDGRSVVFQAVTDGETRLWLRPLEAEHARALAGTDGAVYPFWSPDSRSIGFFAEQKLKRIEVAGGAARVLAEAPYGTNGASWNRDGLILFVPANGSPIYRLPSDGGSPVAVTRLDPPRQLAHRFPHFLPDGRHFVFWVSGSPDVNGVHLGDLESGLTSRLLEADMLAGLAPPGWLLYVRRETLFAERLDSRTFELTGDPSVITEQVERDQTIELRPAVSASIAGPIAYRIPATARRHVIRVDRMGRQTTRLGEFTTNTVGGALRVSPDGRVVGFVRRVSGETDVWLMETARGVLRRFTSDIASDGAPVWSPDGTRVAFDSNRRGVRDLYQRSVGSVGSEEVLLESSESKNLNDWSPDGRFVLYSSLNPATARDLWALPLDGDRKPIAIVRTQYEESAGRFSPDGRLISYQSNETGRIEVHVRAFAGQGSSVRVSTDGGTDAEWGPTGREIYYLAPDGRLMAAPITSTAAGDSIAVGTPAALFSVPPGADYDVARDGRHFLINAAVGDPETPPITVLLNWKGPR